MTSREPILRIDGLGQGTDRPKEEVTRFGVLRERVASEQQRYGERYGRPVAHACRDLSHEPAHWYLSHEADDDLANRYRPHLREWRSRSNAGGNDAQQVVGERKRGSDDEDLREYGPWVIGPDPRRGDPQGEPASERGENEVGSVVEGPEPRKLAAEVT